ncbi:alpha-N-acetylgalactosaminidase (plasmid) [Persicobacter psychrovividus]|uniref:Alpha-N-acetylgalactosaminidase n=2 Tax=Persicobacter psychrovividus TaxID=387638 RepID=A0ABM7VMD6_9BACT|nr:alpha-N-acetylgalactosaminidase [Persicobacter psychrovividus]
MATTIGTVGLGTTTTVEAATLAASQRKKKKRGANDKPKIGLIGVGARGYGHLILALNDSEVDVTAICDLDPKACERAKKIVAEHQPSAKPTYYTGDEYAFQTMLDKEGLDGVIISTPWRWHAPMAVACMKAGAYAGVEVSAAMTIEECWDLVNAYEETKVPCMILENVNYRRDVMAVLNMVRQNMFGELVHFRGGYCHDLRHIKFNSQDPEKWWGVSGVEFGENAASEAQWRTQHSLLKNGDVYPTHGLGPVAMYANINRGNRFESISSMASKAVGLHDYIMKHPEGGPNHKNASLNFKLGDVITSQIKCTNGETILLTHDTNLARPYSLEFRVQGTGGLWECDADHMHIVGESKPHYWDSAKEWIEKYDHPIWKKYENDAKEAGHGGMDFFVIKAFLDSIKTQTQPPLDVYDAAAWSSVTPLSEASIAQGGTAQIFPDFTRGKWINRKPIYTEINENILG